MSATAGCALANFRFRGSETLFVAILAGVLVLGIVLRSRCRVFAQAAVPASKGEVHVGPACQGAEARWDGRTSTIITVTVKFYLPYFDGHGNLSADAVDANRPGSLISVPTWSALDVRGAVDMKRLRNLSPQRRQRSADGQQLGFNLDQGEFDEGCGTGTGHGGSSVDLRHFAPPSAGSSRSASTGRQTIGVGFVRTENGTRFSAAAALLLTSLLLTATMSVARADGASSAADIHVAQTLGERELTVIIRRPSPTLGPLQVEIVTHGPTVAGVLDLSASSPSATTSTGKVELGTEPGMHKTMLSVDRVGPWELSIDDGSTTARIPFIVPTQNVAPWQQASDYGFGAAGVLLAGSLVLALRAKRTWIPWIPAMGAVIALSVGATGAAMSAHSPPPPQAGRDVDPTMNAITDPYAQVPGNAQLAVDYTRPPLILDVSTTSVAEQSSVLDLTFLDSATGRPADDLVVHHSAFVHLMIVTPAGELLHLHPVRVAPGRYEVRFTPSAAGVHAVAAEVSRRGGGAQQLRTSIDIQPGAAGPQLVTDQTKPLAEGEVTVDVADAGVPSVISSRFGDEPTLQPWLGMTGHLIVIGPLPSSDTPPGQAAAEAPIWSHGHAMPPPVPGGTGGQPDESVAVFGPEVDFTYTFARPGRYQIWVQAERDFAVLTMSTEVEVPAS